MPGTERASCKALTSRFPVFQSEERLQSCTRLTATVAEVLAETLARFGGTLPDAPIPG
jgi:hypothetical protein